MGETGEGGLNLWRGSGWKPHGSSRGDFFPRFKKEIKWQESKDEAAAPVLGLDASRKPHRSQIRHWSRGLRRWMQSLLCLGKTRSTS